SPDLASRGTYPVLASLSRGYPGLKGGLPTCYSPVRHSNRRCIATPTILVRLACVKYAASVRSEPGSNSPRKAMNLVLKLEPGAAICVQSRGGRQGAR